MRDSSLELITDKSPKESGLTDSLLPGFPQPGVEASSPSFRCHYFPLLVSKGFSRVDLFNGMLGSVKVTALHVTGLGNVTVAHMGTADGRILQVGPPRHHCLSLHPCPLPLLAFS